MAVKSVFIAGVPEYKMLIMSAFFVHWFLKIYSRCSGSLSNGPPFLDLVMILRLASHESSKCLLMTDWTTLVLSRQSMQLVLKTPF